MTPAEREKALQEAKKVVAEPPFPWAPKRDDYQDTRIRLLYSVVKLLIMVVEDLNVPGHPYRE